MYHLSLYNTNFVERGKDMIEEHRGDTYLATRIFTHAVVSIKNVTSHRHILDEKEIPSPILSM